MSLGLHVATEFISLEG